MRGKGIFVNMFLLSATLFSIFLIGEFTLRGMAYMDDRKIMCDKIISSHKLQPNADVMLIDTVQLSDNRKIIYEIKENIKVNVKTVWGDKKTQKINNVVKHHLRTNSSGTRCGWDDCKNPSLSKPRDVKRIIGIGDSVMYGFNLNFKDSYLSLLEDSLNHFNLKKSRWEVINLAVFGYNTVMEVEALKEKGLAMKPDIVVVGYVPNDLNLPNFIRNEEDYYTVGRSFFLEYICCRVGLLDMKIRRKVEFIMANIGLNKPSQVPSKYKDMVGWKSYEAAMSELADLGAKNDFEVVVVYYTHGFGKGLAANNRSRELSKKLGFKIVDMEPVLDSIMKKMDMPQYSHSSLTMSDHDPHPSAITQWIIAKALHSAIASL
jgi:hypothetical protein